MRCTHVSYVGNKDRTRYTHVARKEFAYTMHTVRLYMREILESNVHLLIVKCKPKNIRLLGIVTH